MNESYKYTNSLEKMKHLMYIDDIKIFNKNKKREQETLIQTIRTYSQGIGIEFGIEKCDMHIMKCVKEEIMEVIELQNQENIRSLGERENYL